MKMSDDEDKVWHQAKVENCQMKAEDRLVKELLQFTGIAEEDTHDVLTTLKNNNIKTWGSLLASTEVDIVNALPKPYGAVICRALQRYNAREAAAAGEFETPKLS